MIEILKQDYHRNGMGGEGFIVSLFTWDVNANGMDDKFVAISFDGPHLSGDTSEDRREFFRSHTAVLNIHMLEDGNIEFAKGNSWRGADHVGPELVGAWEKTNPDFFEVE